MFTCFDCCMWQGVLEFIYPDDRFHISSDSGDFDMFGHGGMMFWFCSSIFFCVVSTRALSLSVSMQIVREPAE